MAKKLLIKIPKTGNGGQLLYDKNNEPLFQTTIVELGAKALYEDQNAKLPKHLRMSFEEIEVEDAISLELSEVRAELKALKEQKELLSQEAEIKALKEELEMLKANEAKTIAIKKSKADEEQNKNQAQ